MIRLVISDLDGTMATPEKTLTPRTIEAIHKLKSAGIEFAVTSGRPPRGMRNLLAPLGLSTPIAAFNGGILMAADGVVLDEHALPPDVAEEAIRRLEGWGLDVWIYRGDEWLLRDPGAPHVDRESFTVKYDPTIVQSFEGRTQGVVKVVGVSDDHPLVERCESELGKILGDKANAVRSQPYYLDVTHPLANKGYVAERLSRILGIPSRQIAAIGDMPNDLLMFEKSGLGIAMGNASEEVKRRATFVTSTNAEDGFARAIEEFVLKQARAA